MSDALSAVKRAWKDLVTAHRHAPAEAPRDGARLGSICRLSGQPFDETLLEKEDAILPEGAGVRFGVVLDRRRVGPGGAAGPEVVLVAPLHFQPDQLLAGDVWIEADENTWGGGLAVQVWNAATILLERIECLIGELSPEAVDMVKAMVQFRTLGRIVTRPKRLLTGPEEKPGDRREAFRKAWAGVLNDLAEEAVEETEAAYGAATRQQQKAVFTIPATVWVYRASKTFASEAKTYDLARRSGYIWRKYYDKTNRPVTNLDKIKMGDLLVLAYSHGETMRLLGLFRIGLPSHCAPANIVSGQAFVEIPSEYHGFLERERYPRDPVLGKYVGLQLMHIRDLDGIVPRIPGNCTVMNAADLEFHDMIMQLIEPDDSTVWVPESKSLHMQFAQENEIDEFIRHEAEKVRTLVEGVMSDDALAGRRLPIQLSIDPWSNLADSLRDQNSPVWNRLGSDWQNRRNEFRSALQVARESEFGALRLSDRGQDEVLAALELLTAALRKK